MSKWTEDTTVKFVEEYLKNDCLWNLRSTNYRNKQAKQQGLANIVSAMAINTFGIKEVESKIKSIRSTYTQELTKMKNSTKSGAGTDDIYKPHIKWFDMLHQALNSVNCDTRNTQSTLGNNDENSGDNSIDQTTYAEISQSPPTSEQQCTIPNATNATRKRRIRDLHSLVDKMSSINNTINATSSSYTIEHEFDQFGKSIASQLKAMPLLLALHAQKYIQNYLSELRIQQLIDSSRTSSPMYSNISYTPSPSSNTYYVESPEQSSSSIGQNPQNLPTATLTTMSTLNAQSQVENNLTMYSEAGDESQSILGPDILSQAVASIVNQ